MSKVNIAIRPRIIDEEEMADYDNPTSTDQNMMPPTDVCRFAVYLASTMFALFGLTNPQNDDETEKVCMNNFQSYLVRAYNRCVFEGKDFKSTLIDKKEGKCLLTTDATEEPKDHKKASLTQIHYDGYLNEVQCQGTLLCCLVKGNESDNTIRNEFIKGTRDGVEIDIPVMTLKLYQAVISIACTLFSVNHLLRPAQLCANIFKECKIPASQQNQHNWGVHGHTGMHFVANFVKNYLKPLQDDAATVATKKALLDKMPSIEHFMMAAVRLDNVNRLKKVKGRKAEADDDHQTLAAVCRTCQITEAQGIEMMSKIDPTQWGIGTSSNASTVATAIAASLSRKEAGLKAGTSGTGTKTAQKPVQTTNFSSLLKLT